MELISDAARKGMAARFAQGPGGSATPAGTAPAQTPAATEGAPAETPVAAGTDGEGKGGQVAAGGETPVETAPKGEAKPEAKPPEKPKEEAKPPEKEKSVPVAKFQRSQEGLRKAQAEIERLRGELAKKDRIASAMAGRLSAQRGATPPADATPKAGATGAAGAAGAAAAGEDETITFLKSLGYTDEDLGLEKPAAPGGAAPSDPNNPLAARLEALERALKERDEREQLAEKKRQWQSEVDEVAAKFPDLDPQDIWREVYLSGGKLSAEEAAQQAEERFAKTVERRGFVKKPAETPPKAKEAPAAEAPSPRPKPTAPGGGGGTTTPPEKPKDMVGIFARARQKFAAPRGTA